MPGIPFFLLRKLRGMPAPEELSDGQVPIWSEAEGRYVPGTVGGGGGAVSDASSSAKGVVKLAGDLGGTAASPTVPGLAGKAPTSHSHAQSDVTGLAAALAAKADDGATTTALASKADDAATATALASKAASAHTHPQSDVTGLTSDIAAVQAAAAAAQGTATAALPKAGGAMTGKIVLDGDPTASLHPATRQYVLGQIAALVNGAPGALDTLKEIADALSSDETAAAALAGVVAGKLAAASNLGDLVNAATARTNLGLGNVDNTSDTSKPISTAQAAVNTSTLRRPVRNTIAALGDSITAWGDGNYYYQGYVSDVYLNHLSLETHQRIKYWGHYAKGGVSLTYMRDTLLPLLLANNPLPGACVIFGGTNDISGVGTLADSRTYSLSYSTGVLKNIINSLLTVGIVPILCTLPPRGDQPALNPTIITWNTWVRRYAAANGFPLIDVYAGVAGSDGSWASAAYTLDGEHPSMQGHRVISQQAIANGLPEIFPPNRPATSRSTADLTNLFNNGTINLGLFTTNASGVGTGLSYAGTGTASIVAPVTSDNLMGNWQQIARATGNTGTAFASKTFSAGWSVGDVIAFSCRVQTSGIDTTLTPFSVYMTQAVPGGFTTPNGVSLTFLPEGLNSWTSDVDGLVYREFTIVAGCTTLGFTMQMSAVPNAGTPWLRVGELTVYNLTTGGQLV